MEKHTCKTYFSVNFEFDRQKNAELLKKGRDCAPEEIGIKSKTEAEKFIIDNFSLKPQWERHRFVIGLNEKYDADVNEMIRATLKDLIGKEDKIAEMKEKFSVQTVLEIVPYVAVDSDEPTQNLSLDDDIIDFLYATGTSHDLDYYVI